MDRGLVTRPSAAWTVSAVVRGCGIVSDEEDEMPVSRRCRWMLMVRW